MAIPADLKINGRTALYQQIQNNPNPWKGIVERLHTKSLETFDNFNSLLQNQGWEYDFRTHKFFHNEYNIRELEEACNHNDDLILNQQSKIYEDVRNNMIMLEVIKKPGKIENAMPIVDLLKMKSKYPKEHPKYKSEDERVILTSRLRKFFTKVEAGTMLSDEAKRNKKASRS